MIYKKYDTAQIHEDIWIIFSLVVIKKKSKKFLFKTLKNNVNLIYRNDIVNI